MLTTPQLYFRSRAGLLTPVAPVPAFTGFSARQDGTPPTLPAHTPGTLLIAAIARTSSTPATIDTTPQDGGGAWELWLAEAHGGVALSIAVYTLLATASNHTVTPTNANGLRAVWACENAAKDTINITPSGNSVTLDWEAQPAMTAQSLVGIYAAVSTTQTSITDGFVGTGTPLEVLGFATRPSGSRNASLAGWAGDAQTNLFDAFDPDNTTLDTSSNKMAVVFTIKGA